MENNSQSSTGFSSGSRPSQDGVNTGSYKMEQGRLHYLDTVRGFAALTVLWSHFSFAFGLPLFLSKYHNTPINMLWDGLAAVSMFFVLSGFVLSYRYLNPKSGKKSIFQTEGVTNPFDIRETARFYVKRIFRIYPPFILMLALSIPAFLYLNETFPTSPARSPWLIYLWKNVTVSLPVFIREALLMSPATTYHLVPQGWTLTLEIQLSLMIPFLIPAVLNHEFLTTAIIAAGAALSVIFEKSLDWHVSLLVIALLHFHMGILLAKYYFRISDFVSRSGFFCRSVIVAAGFIFYSFRVTILPFCSDYVPQYAIPCINSLGASFILVACMGFRKVQRFLELPACYFIGKVSYSLYLCHILLMIIAVPRFIRGINTLGVTGESALTLTLLFTTALPLIVAAPLYYIVEKPSMKAGSSFVRWMNRTILSEGGSHYRSLL